MAKNIDFLNNNSVANINNNFGRVKTALLDVVGRSGDSPNQMTADLDMNSNDILNAKAVNADSVIVNGVPVGQPYTTFREGWDITANYLINDIVRYNDALWIAKRSNTGVTPVEGDDWTLFLEASPVGDGNKGDVVVSGDGAVWTVPKLADGDKGDIVISGSGSVWSLEDNSVTEQKLDPSIKSALVGVAATRTALAGMSTTTYKAIDLLEGGRKGLFVWDSSNLSTQVTADPAQALFVAPTVAPTGASGAWRRQDITPVNALWYGVTGDGTTDDTAAIQAFVTACTASRRSGIFPALQYKINGTVSILGTITADFEKTVSFSAYGAVFLVQASTNPFYISGWGNGCKLAWRGGAIWAHNSATPQAGFRLRQTGHHLIEDVIFRSGTNPGQPQNAGYKPIDIGQLINTNQDTGSFWTTIKGCIFASERNSGATNNPNWVGYGVSITGAGNATTVMDCQFERTIRPVIIAPDANGYMANGVLIFANHFEACQNGIIVTGGGVGPTPGGLRIMGNRAEAIADSFVSISSTTGVNAFLTPIQIGYNLIDSATLYALFNPDNRLVQNTDMMQKLTGSASFAASTSVAVTFSPAWGVMNGSVYHVALETPSNANYWVSNKTASGFTINCEVAVSATIQWSVTRRS